MAERPRRIVGNVGREPELAVRPEDACERGNAVVLHEASLPVPSLRPRIGIDQVDPRKRCLLYTSDAADE